MLLNFENTVWNIVSLRVDLVYSGAVQGSGVPAHPSFTVLFRPENTDQHTHFLIRGSL
jgi:hypothetical protein